MPFSPIRDAAGCRCSDRRGVSHSVTKNVAMLRVLTLSTLFPDASRPTFGPFVERQALALAKRTGVEVEVVAPIGLPPLARLHPRYRALVALPLEESWQGVRVHRPRFRHLPGRAARLDARAIAGRLRPLLAALRQRFAFDVIDAQFFWPDGPAAVELGAMFGVPVSIKARGADIAFWGHRPGFAEQIVAAGRRAEGLLAVSDALRAEMVALGMSGERIAVHRTGLDRATFHIGDRAAARAKLGIAGPLIVSVGALIERKGQRFAIDALPALPGVTLVLIGKGEDETALRDLAAKRGVAERVRFTGPLPATEIAEWLRAADASVLPTRSEGLANAWVESLACGTPVVTCDVGGACELLDRPEAGVLVERDAGSVAAGVGVVFRAGTRPEAVAATVDRYAWETNAAELHAHLARLVDAYKRTAP